MTIKIYTKIFLILFISLFYQISNAASCQKECDDDYKECQEDVAEFKKLQEYNAALLTYKNCMKKAKVTCIDQCRADSPDSRTTECPSNCDYTKSEEMETRFEIDGKCNQPANKPEQVESVTEKQCKKAKRACERTCAVNQEPANQQPVNQEPANQQPVNQEPANQQPANQEPANQEPANQQPVNQEPANQQPVNQEPANQQPANQEPANQQPANKP